MATVSELGTPTWSTHLPLLLAAVLNSEGPVLEIGIGHFSTPILHAVCKSLGRELVSVEDDPQWVAKFADEYENASHEFRNGFDCLPELSQVRWGAVLIDESPGARRGKTLDLFGETADFLVMHDTQAADVTRGLFGFSEGFKQWTDTRYEVHATIFSKRRELPAVI